MQTEDRGDSAPTASVLVENGSEIRIQALFSYYPAGISSAAAVRVDAASAAVVEVYRQYHSYHPLYYNCSLQADNFDGSEACVAATDFAFANATL